MAQPPSAVHPSSGSLDFRSEGEARLKVEKENEKENENEQNQPDPLIPGQPPDPRLALGLEFRRQMLAERREEPLNVLGLVHPFRSVHRR